MLSSNYECASEIREALLTVNVSLEVIAERIRQLCAIQALQLTYSLPPGTKEWQKAKQLADTYAEGEL
jgi:hypothetical protein